MVTYIPLLVALLGLLMYALSSKDKISHVGFVLFCIGTFVFMQAVGNRTVKLF